MVIAFVLGLVLGFAGAYAWDTFLVWRDERKWR
jgi:hypothetical protein